MIQDQTPSWSFKLDEVSEWVYWSEAFTKSECEIIVAKGLEKKPYPASVNNEKIKEDIRKSNVAWIAPTDDFAWIYRRVTDIVLELNSRYFNFDLFGITESFQFTEYKSDNNHYSKHVDRKSGMVIRKLSISIQLTDPNTYIGGELLLYFDNDPVKTKTDQGTLIMFPSYTLHEVTPVTKGTRHSLVAWVTGKNFV